MANSGSTTAVKSLQPVAAVLAWVWPGLGHISLGQRKRGLLIMFGVLFLFLGGVLIGGVDVVDRRKDRLWFVAQSLCGPIAFGVDLVNQYVKNPDRFDRDGARGVSDGAQRQYDQLQYRTTSLVHVNEIGTLFAALAGLMNLAVILDVLHNSPSPPLERRTRNPEGDQARTRDG
ncbi:MAG: DUF6677 family protein [Planctomycetota bacterium]|jgi:hypothetical protein